jgi:hypothetical protein
VEQCTQYNNAERFLRSLLESRGKVSTVEAISKLEERGFGAGAASASLWGLVGAGNVLLSEDWTLTLSHASKNPSNEMKAVR